MRTRTLDKRIDHDARPCDVASGAAAERLAQRTGVHIDLVEQIEMLDRTARGRADHAHAV